MKKTLFILMFMVLVSCQSDIAPKKYFKATSTDTLALLDLTITNNKFYGNYKIKYSGDQFSGQVRGEVIGDTLIGRFKYNTAQGTFAVKPFVLLKKEDTYIQGTGVTWIYLNIPYFEKTSIQFKTTNLHFVPSTQW